LRVRVLSGASLMPWLLVRGLRTRVAQRASSTRFNKIGFHSQ